MASIRSRIGENMKDRYLFKAKRTDNGEWVQGYLVETRYNTYHDGYRIIDKNGINYDELDYYEPSFISYVIDKTTVCQCTGLKDKNGKLIWENDIVAYWDTYSTENGMAEADCIGKVFWDNETMSFEVTNRLSSESYEVLDECSVIGNIFDNKELLESEG